MFQDFVKQRRYKIEIQPLRITCWEVEGLCEGHLPGVSLVVRTTA